MTYRLFRRIAFRSVRRGRNVLFTLFPSLVEAIEYRNLINELRRKYGIELTNQPAAPHTIGLLLKDGKSHPKSSAFIRLLAPLSYIHKKYDIRLALLDSGYDKEMIKNCRVVIVQRTALDTEAEARVFIESCKQNKTKLIFDTDDGFHAIDKSHPEYELQDSRMGAVKYIEPYIDEAWISTKHLSDEFEQTVKNRIVFFNTVDARVWHIDESPVDVPDVSEPLRIIYMGTATHSSDFKLVLGALELLAREKPCSFSLTIIGVGNDIPEYEWITRLYQPRGGSLYPRFVQWFQQQGPFDIGLAPLVDSDFNRSKSDIKCLDYLAAGIDPVVSDVEAYKTPELTPFITRVPNTPQSWEQALREQIENKLANRNARSARITKACEYMLTERSTRSLAEEMYQRINSLIQQS